MELIKITQKEFFPVIPEVKVKHLRAQFNKRKDCSCGYKGLHKIPIHGYPNHPGGWNIGDMTSWWLFIICPNCDYAWSLQKLGTRRDNY